MTKTTIRFRLILLVTACVLPAALLAAALIAYNHDQNRAGDLTLSLLGLFTGTLLVLGGSVAAAWRIGARVSGAIQSLVRPALALGRGE